MASIRARTISSNASRSPWRARSTSDRSVAGWIGCLQRRVRPSDAGRCRQVQCGDAREALFRNGGAATQRSPDLPGGKPSDSVGVGPPPSAQALPCHCNEMGLSGVLERINDARTIRREHPGSSPDSAQETRHGHQRYQAKIRSGSLTTVGLPGAGMSVPGRADRLAPTGSILPPSRRGPRRDRRSGHPAGARLAASRTHRLGAFQPLVAVDLVARSSGS
jgi:hypothetical protein